MQPPYIQHNCQPPEGDKQALPALYTNSYRNDLVGKGRIIIQVKFGVHRTPYKGLGTSGVLKIIFSLEVIYWSGHGTDWSW